VVAPKEDTHTRGSLHFGPLFPPAESMVLFIWGGRENQGVKIRLFRRTDPLMRYIENVSNGIFENGKD
jgi:hypothetical protein